MESARYVSGFVADNATKMIFFMETCFARFCFVFIIQVPFEMKSLCEWNRNKGIVEKRNILRTMFIEGS